MNTSIVAGKGLVVIGGYASNPYVNMSMPSAGMVRWNGTMSTMEVYDGNIWQALHGTHSSIELDQDTQRVLDWARKKMAEEVILDGLCEKYPGLKKARENFELIRKVVESSEESVPTK